jgi:tetratricopeptide (TPR) repeat protein
MTLAVSDDRDIAPLPVATPRQPAVLSQITPLRDALGLDSDNEPGVVAQARALVERHPGSAIALARLAQAWQAVGDPDAACSAARAVVAIAANDPAAAQARHAAALVLAANGAPDTDAALAGDTLPGAALARASRAAEAGRREHALLELAGVESALADAMRGWLLVESEPSAAISVLRAAMAKGLRSVDVLVNLGYALHAVGSVRKAAAVTREATAIAPADVTAAYNLTVYLRQIGRPADALAELSRVAKLHPDDPELALRHAWAYINLVQDPRAALRCLRTSLARLSRTAPAGKRAEFEASIAFLEHRLGRRTLKATREYLWKRIPLVPHTGEVASMLAGLYREPEDLPEMRRLIREAGAALGPARTLVQRARVAVLENDLPEAISLALEAVEAAPTDPYPAGFATYLVGEAGGDYHRASEIGLRAHRANPEHSLTNNLAFALALAHRGAEAAKVIRDSGGSSQLPFGGATAALAELAQGRVASALNGYALAVARVAEQGDQEMAELIDWRRRLAMVQFGLTLLPKETLDEPDGSTNASARIVLREVARRLRRPRDTEAS